MQWKFLILLIVVISLESCLAKRRKRGDTYKSLGCYHDNLFNRALPEKLSDHVDIKTCYELAKAKGYKVFGVQNQGTCYSGPNAREDYDKYGSLLAICFGGKGGLLTNDIYEIIRKA